MNIAPSSAFEAATSLSAGVGGGFLAHTDRRFWTGSAPFGGWSAAIAMKAILLETDRSTIPIVMQVRFQRALSEGAVAVHTSCAQKNRSSAFWRATLGAPDNPAVIADIVLARRRATLCYQEIFPPPAAPPESAVELDPTLFPGAWTDSFELRHIVGAPLQRGDSSRSLTWIRLRDRHLLDFVSLAAYCDAAIARLFYRTQMRSPISTIALSANFHADAADLTAIGDDYVLTDARGRIAGNGFLDQSLAIWSRAGALLATSEQMVWFNSTQE